MAMRAARLSRAWVWARLTRTQSSKAASRASSADTGSGNALRLSTLSRAADHYEAAVLADCCTTVDQMLHAIALDTLSIRVLLPTAAQALA